MERVVVLGPAGAGKSALARELSRRAGLPVVHLDRIFWGEGWARAPAESVRPRFDDAVAGDRWILDGNFLGDRRLAEDARFERADTVVFLDLPRRTCFRRVLARAVRDRGRRRPDLPEGAYEGFDLPLLRWIWTYPRKERPRVLELLEGLDARVAVHHLRSARDLERFLEEVHDAARPGFAGPRS